MNTLKIANIYGQPSLILVYNETWEVMTRTVIDKGWKNDNINSFYMQTITNVIVVTHLGDLRWTYSLGRYPPPESYCKQTHAATASEVYR